MQSGAFCIQHDKIQSKKKLTACNQTTFIQRYATALLDVPRPAHAVVERKRVGVCSCNLHVHLLALEHCASAGSFDGAVKTAPQFLVLEQVAERLQRERDRVEAGEVGAAGVLRACGRRNCERVVEDVRVRDAVGCE